MGAGQMDLVRSDTRGFQKTPKSYVSAGKYLQQLDEKLTTLGYLYSNANAKHDQKFVLPLLRNVVRYRQVIEHLITSTPIHGITNVNPYLVRVAIYEQTFNKRHLVGDAKGIQCVREHQAALDKALADYLTARGARNLREFLNQTKDNETKLPIYVRVNSLKAVSGHVLEVLENEGYEEVPYDKSIPYDKFLELVSDLFQYQFIADQHVPDMYIFHCTSGIGRLAIAENKDIIIQNKSSCLAPILLNPPPGSVVMDCCAAPGMKTTYLASLMYNEGRLYANDRNQERSDQMTVVLERAGVKCAETSVKDFTAIEPNQKPYCDVQYILVDPSCSGSGNVKSFLGRNLVEEEDKPTRLENLSYVLRKILCHALRFPKVQRVVYSTCSIYTIENESVVTDALSKFGDSFELEEPPSYYPFRTANKRYLKLTPEKDLTNGFFVAILQRKESLSVSDNIGEDGESNEQPMFFVDTSRLSNVIGDVIPNQPEEDAPRAKGKDKKLRKKSRPKETSNDSTIEDCESKSKKRKLHVDTSSVSDVIGDVTSDQPDKDAPRAKRKDKKLRKKSRPKKTSNDSTIEDCESKSKKRKLHVDTSSVSDVIGDVTPDQPDKDSPPAKRKGKKLLKKSLPEETKSKSKKRKLHVDKSPISDVIGGVTSDDTAMDASRAKRKRGKKMAKEKRINKN